MLTVDADTAEVLDAWGENTFYVPHGIAVDAAGSVYVTDAGAHQVLRVSAANPISAVHCGSLRHFSAP